MALLGLLERSFFVKDCVMGYVADGGLSKKNIQLNIMLTYQFNVDPLTPQFYIVKQVYRGIHFVLTFALKHRLWVLLRTASVRRF